MESCVEDGHIEQALSKILDSMTCSCKRKKRKEVAAQCKMWLILFDLQFVLNPFDWVTCFSWIILSKNQRNINQWSERFDFSFSLLTASFSHANKSRIRTVSQKAIERIPVSIICKWLWHQLPIFQYKKSWDESKSFQYGHGRLHGHRNGSFRFRRKRF